MNKIKKGDTVIVIAGKDKGKTGTVLSVHESGRMLKVEGINLAKKHTKPNPNAGDQGGVVLKVMPIDRSNVMLYDPISKKRSKVGIRTLKDGTRVRFYKASDQVIEAKE